jgi:hypothetical protein
VKIECQTGNDGQVQRSRHPIPPTKYNFLFDGELGPSPLLPTMDSGPSGDVPLVPTNATDATDKYRAKAYKLLSLAERASDPEQRADLLLCACMWMSLTEAIEDLPPSKLPHEI